MKEIKDIFPYDECYSCKKCILNTKREGYTTVVTCKNTKCNKKKEKKSNE